MNKVDKSNAPFDVWLDNELRANGFLFPESDKQMENFESTTELQDLPSHLRTADFIYEH